MSIISEKLTLADLSPGDIAVIERLDNCSPIYCQSLYSMGLIPGTELEVIRFAPLGDPIQLSVRGSQLSIRKSDARCLILRRIEDASDAE